MIQTFRTTDIQDLKVTAGASDAFRIGGRPKISIEVPAAATLATIKIQVMSLDGSTWIDAVSVAATGVFRGLTPAEASIVETLDQIRFLFSDASANGLTMRIRQSS